MNATRYFPEDQQHELFPPLSTPLAEMKCGGLGYEFLPSYTSESQASPCGMSIHGIGMPTKGIGIPASYRNIDMYTRDVEMSSLEPNRHSQPRSISTSSAADIRKLMFLNHILNPEPSPSRQPAFSCGRQPMEGPSSSPHQESHGQGFHSSQPASHIFGVSMPPPLAHYYQSTFHPAEGPDPDQPAHQSQPIGHHPVVEQRYFDPNQVELGLRMNVYPGIISTVDQVARKTISKWDESAFFEPLAHRSPVRHGLVPPSLEVNLASPAVRQDLDSRPNLLGLQQRSTPPPSNQNLREDLRFLRPRLPVRVRNIRRRHSMAPRPPPPPLPGQN